MNIACACDDGYAQHTGVMLYSLLENASEPEKIKIYLIDGGISKNNKERIERAVKKFSSEIVFLNPSFEKINKMNLKNHGKMTYTKFFLPNMLDNKKRILYLDSDIIVKGNILELEKFELNKSLAAISEGKKLHKHLKKKIGIPAEKEYFNAGVLLIDLKKFRENKYPEKISQFLIENSKKVEHSDQDGFNYCLQNDWQKLNPVWNVLSILYTPYLFKYYFDYSRKEIKKIRENARIIHFTDKGYKPWLFISPHPKKKEYWKYLKKTPWRDYKDPDKNIKGFLKKEVLFLKRFIHPKIKDIIKK